MHGSEGEVGVVTPLSTLTRNAIPGNTLKRVGTTPLLARPPKGVSG
jgi:hypothetical protein